MTKSGRLSYGREVSRIVNQDGYRGLFRGFFATMWRDVPGWSVLFGSYSLFKSWAETKDPSLRVIYTMHAAGMAGALARLPGLPMDVIKSKQMMNLDKQPLSMVKAYRQVIAEGGRVSLLRGAQLAVIRGYICASIMLPLYDNLFASFLNTENAYI